jgi:hypothetical protein
MTKIVQWAKSSRKGKKYMVLLDNGKTVHFGSSDYQQYRDSTPLKLYSSLDHLDEARRNRYYARHKYNYPQYTPDWLSKTFLWT